MQHMHHFTSKKNWGKIKKAKKLTPQTIIESAYNKNKKDFSERIKSVCTEKRYTVGFPKPFHKGWVEYGLWEELFRLINCQVLLKIKIPKRSKGFVREHAFCSPKGMKEKYGKDVYFLAYLGKISIKDPRMKDSLIKYWNSTVPLLKYKNNFIVPEIWIPEKISLEDLEEIPFPN